MTIAQEQRLRAYLDALRPHAVALRGAGFPVEVEVRADGDHVHVHAILDIDDTRVPVEAA